MRKFGFKFFSTNFQIAPVQMKAAIEFVASQKDMFIEITAALHTTEAEFKQIKEQLGNVEVRIHASTVDFNPGDKKLAQQNRKNLAIAQKAADLFNAQTIVVHPGYGHGQKYLEETARQFRLFQDDRIVVENLPYYDNNGDHLHGATAEEISYIMRESGCGFCFDFSHAICSAVALNSDIEKFLQSLYALKPRVYHMCDGYLDKMQDEHLHFLSGNYPLQHYLHDYTDQDAYITMETGNGFEPYNDLRIKDYEYLKSFKS